MTLLFETPAHAPGQIVKTVTKSWDYATPTGLGIIDDQQDVRYKILSYTVGRKPGTNPGTSILFTSGGSPISGSLTLYPAGSPIHVHSSRGVMLGEVDEPIAATCSGSGSITVSYIEV
jgi:hypothetical protein